MVEDIVEEIPPTNLHKINAYTCEACYGVIVTIDNAIGVTPFMLSCRSNGDCNGNMYSHGYNVDQTLTPTYEWYKPRLIMASRKEREHIKKGGLSIRKLKK
jgi:hypothetical protein